MSWPEISPRDGLTTPARFSFLPATPMTLRNHGIGGRMSRPRTSSNAKGAHHDAAAPSDDRGPDPPQHLPKTARRYIKWVADFAQHFHTSPEHLGAEHVRSYLLHLLQERKIPSRVHKEARQALKFLYRVTLGREEVVEKVAHPKAPKTLPVVLSQDEMARFLDALQNPKHRAVLMTAYAGGLRLSEVARLRVEDIDSARMVIHVRQGKGHKDRDVMLSPRLLAVLREYWKINRPKPYLFPGCQADQPMSAPPSRWSVGVR